MTRALLDLLTAAGGVKGQMALRLQDGPVRLDEIPYPRIVEHHAAIEVTDKAQGTKYPQILVYCDRVHNLLTEKFRRFSGRVDAVVEIRNSQDRLDELEQWTHLYTEAVLAVLEGCRGEWREGVYYCGKYEVKFEAAKHGGKNFVKVVRVMLPVDVNIA
ncbi:MAG: hypothetical protein U0Q16_11645 [Bryobacteraceae bacterium]